MMRSNSISMSSKMMAFCCLAIFLVEKETLAFTGVSPPLFVGKSNFAAAAAKQRLSSSLMGFKIDEETSSTSTEGIKYNNDEHYDVAKEKAITELQKLLTRQKMEAKETELMLEKLKLAAATLEYNDAIKGEEPSISISESIASGFDYGFISRSEGSSFSYLKGGGRSDNDNMHGPPANVFKLSYQQFFRNLDAIKGEYKDEAPLDLTTEQLKQRQALKSLTINCTAIWERELEHGPIVAPLVIKIPYLFLCYLLDTVFEDRYVPSRFYLLETVARMPYFAYITMIHLYETLGFWRRSADIKRIHFAEELNEFRHLLIMESLGGDQPWWVRFIAQHSAVAYYIALCMLWLISPTLSYKFSELLETHAVNTYGQFLDENEEKLKEMPPSLAAVEYYSFGISDPFYAEIQTNAVATGSEIRRPGENLNSLYDVFCAIREDEGDHVSTMTACMDKNVAVTSPSLERKALVGIALAAAAGYYALGPGGEYLNLINEVNSIDPAQTGNLIESGNNLMETADGGSRVADLVEKIFNDDFSGFLDLGTGTSAGDLLQGMFNIDVASLDLTSLATLKFFEEILNFFTNFL